MRTSTPSARATEASRQTPGGLGNERRARRIYDRKPAPLFDGCRLSSPLHQGIQARYPSEGGVGESGSKPSCAGVSGMRSTRKYLSLSSQCSRTMVRNSDSSQYRTPVIGFLLNTTILYSQ